MIQNGLFQHDYDPNWPVSTPLGTKMVCSNTTMTQNGPFSHNLLQEHVLLAEKTSTLRKKSLLSGKHFHSPEKHIYLSKVIYDSLKKDPLSRESHNCLEKDSTL